MPRVEQRDLEPRRSHQPGDPAVLLVWGTRFEKHGQIVSTRRGSAGGNPTSLGSGSASELITLGRFFGSSQAPVATQRLPPIEIAGATMNTPVHEPSPMSSQHCTRYMSTDA